MEPKIETINVAYFIPGTVLGIALALSIAEVAHMPLKVLFSYLSSVGVGAIFLGVAYVLGFAMWAVADQKWRTDRTIAARMLFYICRDRSLREEYIRLCIEAKAEKIADAIKNLSKSIPDQLNSDKASANEAEAQAQCSRRSQRKSEEEAFERACNCVDDNPGLERRLQMIAWDQSYNDRNQYHIGRFLSDWNNFKFAKSTMISLLMAGIVYLLASTIWNWGGEFDVRKAVAVVLFFSSGRVYLWITRWRLRAFARDLAHALAPTHTRAKAV